MFAPEPARWRITTYTLVPAIAACTSLCLAACDEPKATARPDAPRREATEATAAVAIPPAPTPAAPPALRPLRPEAAIANRAPSEAAPTDQPNYFTNDISSSGVVVAYLKCADSAVKAQPSLERQPELLSKYCGCTTDALRANVKRLRSLDITKAMPSWAQIQACGEHAKDPLRAMLKEPSPYAPPEPQNQVQAVWTAIQSCEKMQAQDLEPGARSLYCSCHVDAMRSNTAPVLTQDQRWRCEQAAAHRLSTGEFLTKAQFKALRRRAPTPHQGATAAAP